MGGGLGFLNKKTWHPGRLSNVENVWKKEQEHLKEQTKLEDLRKQIADERQKEELEMVAAAAGHKVRSDRLDWMYQGGMLAKQEAEKRQEEAMMSGKPVQQAEETQLERGNQAVLLPTFYSEDTPASANETWARLHSDPLFAIRQQEQSARKAIVSNPVKMDHIKAEVDRLQKSKSMEKAAKKAEKKASKEAKKQKKRAASQMEAALQFPTQGQNGSARQPSTADATFREADRHIRQQEQRHQSTRQHQNGCADDNNPRKHKSRRTESPERPAAVDRQTSNGNHANGHSDRHHQRDSEPYGAEDQQQHVDRYKSSRDHYSDRHANSRGQRIDRHEGSRDHDSDRHGRSRDDRRDRYGGSRAHQDDARRDSGRAALAKDDADRRPGEAPAHNRHQDGERQAGRDGTQYGLSWGETAPQQLQSQDRKDAAEVTRKRLEEAAARKAQEDRDKAAQRHQRQEYKTGRLTAEEKARKLAEMQGNAEEHDDARWQRLSDEKKKDAAEAAAQASQTGSAADFMKQAHKTLYGATGEAASLEDRVGRRKYYNDKDTERGAFKR